MVEALEGQGVGAALSVEADEVLTSLGSPIGFNEVVEIGYGLRDVQLFLNILGSTELHHC